MSTGQVFFVLPASTFFSRQTLDRFSAYSPVGINRIIMPKELPKIYQNLSEQDIAEADYNLVGFFRLLYEIDQEIKNNNERNSDDQIK